MTASMMAFACSLTTVLSTSVAATSVSASVAAAVVSASLAASVSVAAAVKISAAGVVSVVPDEHAVIRQAHISMTHNFFISLPPYRFLFSEFFYFFCIFSVFILSYLTHIVD